MWASDSHFGKAARVPDCRITKWTAAGARVDWETRISSVQEGCGWGRLVTEAKQTPTVARPCMSGFHPRGVEVSSPAPSTLVRILDGGRRSNFPSKAFAGRKVGTCMGTTCKEDSADLFVRLMIDSRLKVKCMQLSSGGRSIRHRPAANSCTADCCAPQSSKDCEARWRTGPQSFNMACKTSNAEI